ncbi:unnamed protein product [Absidia cylindrospora]
MGKSRPRYNEKARASSLKPNQRSHPKARNGGLGNQNGIADANTLKKTSTTQIDSNALMIVPGTEAEETEKPTMKQPTKYMSKKKRKKLEKYIVRLPGLKCVADVLRTGR